MIRTYIKHNDRLGIILESIGKPYHIRAAPVPQLSFFLDVDLVIGYYAQVLSATMIQNVDKAMEVWKDPSKEASKLKGMYKFPLPWVPDRDGQQGLFKSFISEDVQRGLEMYMLYARLRREEIALSFYNTLSRVDVKVHAGFVTACQHLADQYKNALIGGSWATADMKPVDESGGAVNAGASREHELDQLTEHSEWVCSVVNDCHRMISRCYLKPVERQGSQKAAKDAYLDYEPGENNIETDEWDMHALSEATIEITDRGYRTLHDTCKLGVEWLSCIIFAKFSSDPELSRLLNRGSCLRAYLSTLPEDALSDPSKQQSSMLHQMVDGLGDLLDAQLDGLERSHFFHLVNLCCNKVVCVALTVVKMASKSRMKIDPHGPFMLQLERDLKHIEKDLTDISKHAFGVEEVTLDGLGMLEMALVLSRSKPESPKFKPTIAFLLRHAESMPSQGGALVKFTDTCVFLTHDYVPPHAKHTAKKKHESDPAFIEFACR